MLCHPSAALLSAWNDTFPPPSESSCLVKKVCMYFFKNRFSELFENYKREQPIELQTKHLQYILVLVIFAKVRNGILFAKLFSPSVKKIVWNIFWNSRLKAENLRLFWDHENNLLEQWKVRTECFLNLFLEVSNLIH